MSGNCNKFYFQGVWPGGFGTDPSWMTMTYEFAYLGDVPKAGTWAAEADGTFTAAKSNCDKGILSHRLFKGKNPYTTLDDTSMNFGVNRKTSQTVQVTWEPGQTYTFQSLLLELKRRVSRSASSETKGVSGLQGLTPLRLTPLHDCLTC